VIAPELLAGLRDLQDQGLPDTCSISRASLSQTGDGTSATWSNAATGVRCRVSPLASGAGEGLIASGAIAGISQWTIWVPALTDVRIADRIVYGSRSFEVNRVGARSYETVRECLCREIA
jgi:head-tail adaptor